MDTLGAILFFYHHAGYARSPTCERAWVELDGTTLAGLGCIDDATGDYRRVVSAELLCEARYELSKLNGQADAHAIAGLREIERELRA